MNAANTQLYYRLIALWAVCEAFAGGVMHAIKVPFAGMFVSGLAVLCIILIAAYVPARGAILQATIIVAILKLALSPHSPPTAYIAVFFQGLLGNLLFLGKKHFKFSAVLLAVLSLTESGLQRLLVLIIIYGKKFWIAVDSFVQKTIGGNDLHYSRILAEWYIIVHAVFGLLVGLFAVYLVRKSRIWQNNSSQFIIGDTADEVQATTKKRGRFKIVFLLIWAFLVFLLVQSYVSPRAAFLPKGEVAGIILRAIIILFTWRFILGPAVMYFIRKKLSAERLQKKLPIQAIINLLPRIKYIFLAAARMSAGERFLKRIPLFTKIIIINILAPQVTTVVSKS